MKTRLITALTTVALCGLIVSAASASAADQPLAWQQPDYVMDVVVVTAPRLQAPSARDQAQAQSDATVGLGSGNPGNVMDIVVVRESRSAILERARGADREAARMREELFRSDAPWNVLGAPAR